MPWDMGVSSSEYVWGNDESHAQPLAKRGNRRRTSLTRQGIRASPASPHAQPHERGHAESGYSHGGDTSAAVPRTPPLIATPKNAAPESSLRAGSDSFGS
ncbi:hypothetical protein GCM10009765_69450 [Fodinicola feengrottensis]|uniref:Uncharacterized protein n=1 Tax=Fodinicola feengrottensis TaxID=435914 RepID=A0ABP4UU29_9ACTN